MAAGLVLRLTVAIFVFQEWRCSNSSLRIRAAGQAALWQRFEFGAQGRARLKLGFGLVNRPRVGRTRARHRCPLRRGSGLIFLPRQGNQKMGPWAPEYCCKDENRLAVAPPGSLAGGVARLPLPQNTTGQHP